MPDATASRRVWLVLGALTLIGFALRIYRLNHSSLWMDEALTIARADPAMSWREFFHFRDTEPHPVWHHGLLRLWLTVFGYTEFQGRFLSVVLGTLSIPATYLLARRFASERGSLFAALVAAFSYYLISFAQDLTGYAHWYAAACLSYWFFFRLCREPTLWAGIGYTVATLIALHIQFHSAFMIAGQFAAALYLGLTSGGVRSGWRIMLRFVVPGLLFALSLVPMMDLIRRAAERPSFIQAPPDGAFPFLYFYGYFGNNILLAALVALPLAFALLVPLQRWAGPSPASASPAHACGQHAGTMTVALLLILVAGLGIPYLVSEIAKPLLFHRYTMFTLPVYFALMAIGFDMIAGLTKRLVLAAAVVAASLWVLFVSKDHYSAVKMNQPREVVRFVAEKNAELGVRGARYLANEPSLIHFYMRVNGIRGPISRYVKAEDITGNLGAVVKGDLFWVIADGWDIQQPILAYILARYDRVAEARFRRGYAGLFKVR